MTGDHTSLELLATNVLLGQATTDERARFNTLYENDASFRELVNELEIWLAPLNEAVPEQAPPDDLLDDIMSEIDDTEQAAQPSSPPTGPSTAVPPPPSRAGLQSWRTLAIASTLVAVIAIALHFIPEPPTEAAKPEREIYIVLSEGGEEEAVLIQYNPDDHRIRAQLTNVSVPDTGVWQLWLIREGAGGPQSVGLLNAAGEAGVIELMAQIDDLQTSDTLAISLEPDGGSPEAGPTGPVVFAGQVGQKTAS